MSVPSSYELSVSGQPVNRKIKIMKVVRKMIGQRYLQAMALLYMFRTSLCDHRVTLLD